MAWIEAHQSLPTHLKTKRASRALQISRPQLVGHLLFLWSWALDNAPEGNLSWLTSEEIAEAAGWDGDADQFVTALVEARGPSGHGFIERDEAGVRIHDWDDYAGRLIRRRRANAEQMRQARARDAAEPTSDPSHVVNTCATRD